MARKATAEKRKKSKKRILVIEDDKIVADFEKEILEGEGFHVETAKDGVEGLEKIKQNEYDVIISDCDMPRMSGKELYLEVQRLSQDLASKIILISANVGDFIKSTGNRFLAKPFSPQQLRESVKGLIKSDT